MSVWSDGYVGDLRNYRFALFGDPHQQWLSVW